MLYFIPEVFHCLANQIHGHICVMLEFLFYIWKTFGSYVLLNKRQLTGNRLGSLRRETGRKKIASATPLLLTHFGTNLYVPF